MEDTYVLKKENYPPALLEIPQVPEKLYARGPLPDPAVYTYLAVVGSRKYTSYGRDAVEKLIAGLAGYPVVIVSGLALGIDTLAHTNALKNNLLTIGIPGSGIDPDAMHPKASVQLARDIVDSGGCIMCEMKPHEKATQYSFPQRNRIMAGMCRAVLIIEAEEKSGTLITARLATEYNRDVLVVPGSIFSPNSKGTNFLLRSGATPITCVEDLLTALGFAKTEDTEHAQQKLLLDCSADELRILDVLREPTNRDDLARALDMPIGELNMLLSIMEIKGYIKEEYGDIKRV